MLYKGEGVRMNRVKVCRYFKIAGDKGHIEAMNNYCFMLANGEGVSMKQAGVLKWSTNVGKNAKHDKTFSIF